MSTIKTITAALGGAAVAAAATAFALSGPAEADAKAPSADFTEQVRQVLLTNPEIIFEAVAVHEAKQAQEQQAVLREAVKANLAKIDTTPGIHIAGNPNGKVTMVEFFDYHCGFCKAALPSILDMIENEPELKVAFVEFPILSADSETAARAAIAAGEQGRYLDMHAALMEANGRLNKERIMVMAKDMNFDTVQLERDMASARTDEILAAHDNLANLMRVDGTPAFIVEGTPVTGWREEEVKRLIDEAMAG